MSTYFESINDDGSSVQISDNYESMCVKRTGTFSANHNNGYIYGISLDDDEVFIAFRCENSILYISPIVSYGSKRVCYVSCSTDSAISYFTVGLYNSITKPSARNYGIEIYDENGKIVFSSNESKRATIIDHQHINCSVRDLGDKNQLLYLQNNVNWGTPYSIADTGKRYIASYESPWQTPAVSIPSASNWGWHEHVFLMAGGYDFSGGMIRTQNRISSLNINTADTYGTGFVPNNGQGDILTCTMVIKYLTGDGDFTQLQTTGLCEVNLIMIRYGIMCLDYDFNVVDLLG